MADGREIGSAHAAMLRQVMRAEREEQERREAAAEAHAWRCAAAAPAYREAMQIQRARGAAEEARADREAKRERERKAAEIEDFRCMLLATGQGRWRTVGEVLTSMAVGLNGLG
jgi:hypothetical protein